MGLSIFKFILLLLTLVSTQVLLACPVCGFGQDGSQSAFLLTTALLTFAPIVFIGSIIGYLVYKSRHLA